MPNLKQVSSLIKRDLEKYDFKGVAESRCANEAQARVLLIEPFLSALGYDMMNDVIPEFDADFGARKSNKVDYAITINSRSPIILVEAKSVSTKLSDKHAGQLNNYFVNTSSAKVGLLANGLDYIFYLSNSDGQNVLHPTPFLSFNVLDYSNNDLEELARFHKSVIEPKELAEEADKRAFMESFEEALFQEFQSPSEEFLKALFNRMSNGKRMTKERRETLLELINPFSIKLAYDKLLEAEIESGNSGIITTAEEKKAFHYIHSLFLHGRGIDASRISHRDQKTKFSIVVDDNIRKTICSLKWTKSGIRMEIDGVTFELDKIEELINYSKQLKAVAQRHLS